MSGTTDEETCLICGEEMQVYSDFKPFSHSSGECLNCGFHFEPKIGQMTLEEVNDLRKDYNENNETKLKPLKKSDLLKYKKDIENLW